MRKRTGILLISILAPLSFLLAPKPVKFEGPAASCPIQYVSINKWMGFRMNCDAPTFVGGAVNPGYLFKPRYPRQSRPLYLLTGALLGRGFDFMFGLYPGFVEKWKDLQLDKWVEEPQRQKYMAHYAGLVLLNALVLIWALFLFQSCLKMLSGPWKNSPWLLGAFTLTLASNQLVKFYFWTPHQQMFIILLPLLSIWVFYQVASGNWEKKYPLLRLLGLGMLCLFYGAFVLLLPVWLLARFKGDRQSGKSIKTIILSIFKNSLIFLSPLIGWIMLLQIRGVGFYSHEVGHFREFVWLADLLKLNANDAINKIAHNTNRYAETFGSLLPAASLLALCLLLFRKDKAIPEQATTTKYINAGLLRILILFFLFYGALGYYADRLTYGMAPLLITIAAIWTNRQTRTRKIQWLLAAVIIAWHLYGICHEWPHLSDSYYF